MRPAARVAAPVFYLIAPALLALCIIVQSCGPKTVDSSAAMPSGADRQGDIYLQAAGSSPSKITWIGPGDDTDLGDLNAWRSAVGPALITQPDGLPANVELDSLAVVAWNTAVGGGDVGDLIRDLRAGVLTGGRAVSHFILLLQEVFRAGSLVPTRLSPDARWASRIARSQHDGERIDIERLAEGRELAHYYVPSMRNGPPDSEAKAEDRGNAIISTLRLSDFVALELPLVRERRVVTGATVNGSTTGGKAWSLKLVNVHLETRGDWEVVYKGPGSARLEQAERLVETLGDDPSILVGGDFNTWFMEDGEPAVSLMRKHFPLPPELPDIWTAKAPVGLPSRQIDYMFFKLPEGWEGRYSVIGDTYGSDHRPLLGWVVFRNAGN